MNAPCTALSTSVQSNSSLLWPYPFACCAHSLPAPTNANLCSAGSPAVSSTATYSPVQLPLTHSHLLCALCVAESGSRGSKGVWCFSAGEVSKSVSNLIAPFCHTCLAFCDSSAAFLDSLSSQQLQISFLEAIYRISFNTLGIQVASVPGI